MSWSNKACLNPYTQARTPTHACPIQFWMLLKTLRPAADWGAAGITECSIRSEQLTPCTSAMGRMPMVAHWPRAEVRRRDRTDVKRSLAHLRRTRLQEPRAARGPAEGAAPHAQLSPGGGIHVIAHMNELRGGHGCRKCGCRQIVKIAKPDPIHPIRACSPQSLCSCCPGAVSNRMVARRTRSARFGRI